jgi:hypothetical protein
MSVADIRKKRKEGIELEGAESNSNSRVEAIREKRRQGIELDKGNAVNPDFSFVSDGNANLTIRNRPTSQAPATDITSRRNPDSNKDAYRMAVELAKKETSSTSAETNAGDNRVTAKQPKTLNNYSTPQYSGMNIAENGADIDYTEINKTATENGKGWKGLFGDREKQTISEEQSLANAANTVEPYIKNEDTKKLLDRYAELEIAHEMARAHSGIRWMPHIDQLMFGNDIDSVKAQIQEKTGVSDEELENLLANYKYYADAKNTKQMSEEIDKLSTGTKLAISPIVALEDITANAVAPFAVKDSNYNNDNLGRNYNSGAFTSRNIANAVRESIHKDIDENIENPVLNTVAGKAYDVPMMAAESLITNFAGVPGLLTFGTGAYAENLREAENRGLKESQAQAYAGVMGLTEIATESIPFSNLNRLIKNGATKEAVKGAVMPYFKEVGKQMLEEGGEEAVNDVVDIVADGLINRNQSKLNNNINEYIAAGYSRKEATEKAYTDEIIQIVDDFATGALSGGLSAGAAVGVHAGIDTSIGRTIAKDQQLNASLVRDTESPNYISENREDYLTDEDYEQAQEARQSILAASEKAAKNERISGREARAVYENVIEARSNVEHFQQVQMQKKYEELQAKAETKAVEDVKKASTASEIETIKEQFAQSETVNNAVAEKEAEMIAAGKATENDFANAITPSKAQQMGQKGEEISKEELEQLPQKVQNAYKLGYSQKVNEVTQDITNTDVTGIKVNGKVDSIKSVSKNSDGVIVFETNKGEVVPASDVEFTTNGKYLYNAENGIMSLDNPVLVQLAIDTEIKSKRGVSIGNVTKALQNIYTLGETGVDYASAIQSLGVYKTAVSEEILKKAYDEGAKNATAKNRATIAKKSEGKTTFASEQAQEKYNNEVSEVEKKFLDMFAKKIGVDFTFTYDEKSKDRGQYKPETGSIYINLAMGQDLFEIALHEGIGEFLAASNEKAYNKIVDSVLNAYAATNANDLAATIRAYQEAYANDTYGDTARGASRELFNDALAEIFSSEANMKKMFNWLVENEGVEQAETVKKTLVDYLKDLISFIKQLKSIGKLSTFERNRLKLSEEQASKYVDEILKAMDEAIANRDAGSVQQGKNAPRNSVKILSDGTKYVLPQKDIFIKNDGTEYTRVEAYKTILGKITTFDGKDIRILKELKNIKKNGKAKNLCEELFKRRPGRYNGVSDINAMQRFVNGHFPELLYNSELSKKNEPSSKDHTMYKIMDFDERIVNFLYTDNRIYTLKIAIGNLKNGTQVAYGKRSLDYNEELTKKMESPRSGKSQQIATPSKSVSSFTKKASEKASKNAEEIVNSVQEEGTKSIKVDVPVSANDELVAIHNLSPEQMLSDIKLGGFPSPSIAVIRADMKHDKYGVVSVVFGRDTIDPKKNKKNKVYGGDAWTPTFPSIEYKVSDSKLSEIRDKIRDLTGNAESDFGYIGLDTDNLEDVLGRRNGNMRDTRYYDDPVIKIAFLNDNGIKYKTEYKETRLSNKFENEEVKRFSDAALFDINLAANDYEYGKNNPKVLNDVRKWLNKWWKKNFDVEDLYNEKNFDSFDLRDLCIAAKNYRQKGINQSIDISNTRNHINGRIEHNLEAYNKWFDNLFDGIIEKEGIRNNKDTFTSSGNRRSWESLHEDVTLDNIVKAMNFREAKGDALFAQSALQAVATKDFKSIQDIKDNVAMLKLLTDEEYQEILDEITNRANKIATKLVNPAASNQFLEIDNAFDLMADTIRTKRTASGIFNEMKKWNSRVTPEIAMELEQLVEDISNKATGYFEAKPERAVYMDEVLNVIVPSDETELINALKENDIPYATYQRGNSEDRANAVNLTDNARFSKTVGDIEKKAIEHFGTTDSFRVAGYMLQDGTLLDFSGAHWLEGEDPAYIEDWKSKNDIRQVDHEDIYEVMEASGDNRKQFMDRGNIRLNPEAPGFNLSAKVEPTAAQYRELKEFIREIKRNPYYDASRFYVDIEDTHPNKISYANNLNEDRIINDIKRFYATGELPQESSLNDFRYSKKVDSAGNSLTEGQQEYFADSKIRDDEGRLMVMYHGTNNYGFTVFDKKKAKYSGLYGRGFYFSPVASHAGQYGKQYEVYLNIINPLKSGDHNITKDQLKAFIAAVAEDEDYGIENYGYDATVDSVTNDIWKHEDDFAMLQDVNAACVGDFVAAVKLFNEVNGTDYDGITIPSETVAFEANQIKNIDNENPTADDDIRYSINIDEDRIYNYRGVEIVKNPTDAEYRAMRKEIKEQRPWLRDDEPLLRKTYDEEGNEYYWEALAGMHRTIEPAIRKHWGVRVAQNYEWWKDEDKYFWPEYYEERYSKVVFGDASQYAERLQQTEYVSEVLSTLNNQLKGNSVSMPYINDTVKYIKDKYASNIDEESLKMELAQFIAYMMTEDRVDYNQMMNYLMNIGDEVIKESQLKDPEEERIYSELKKELLSHKIKLTEEEKKQLMYKFGGSWNEVFGKLNRIGIKLDNKHGQIMDAGIYQEIVDSFRKIAGIQLDDATSAVDQIATIIDTMDAMEPGAYEWEGASEMDKALDVATTIIDRYYSMASNIKESNIVKGTDKGKAAVERAKQTEIKKLRAKQQEYKSKLNAEFQALVEDRKKVMQEQQEFYKRQAQIEKQFEGKERDLTRRKKLTDSEIEKTARIQAKLMYQGIKDTETKRKQKDNIVRTCMRLINWMQKPTDARHVPTFLKPALTDLIQSINFMPASMRKGNDGTISAQKWQDSMRKLQSVLQQVNSADMNSMDDSDKYNLGLVMDTEDIIVKMEELLKKYSGTADISRMAKEDLKTLNDIMNSISKAVSLMNTNFMNRRFEHVSDAATAAITEMKELKPISNSMNFAKSVASDFLNLDMAEPITFFEELGEASESIMQEFFDGEKIGVEIIHEADDFFKRLGEKLGLKTKDIRAWENDLKDYHFDGKTISLTSADIMSLYCSYHRELLDQQERPFEATHHIAAGGIKGFRHRVGFKEVNKNPEVMHLTQGQLIDLMNNLTEQQKAYADAVVEYMSTTLAAHGNETSNKLNGYSKFNGKYYFPLKTDTNTLATTESNNTSDQASFRRLIFPSFTKAQLDKADNALVIQNFFDVVTEHITGMSNYCAYSMPISDAMRWYNYAETERANTDVEDEYQRYTTTLKDAMVRVRGDEAKKYFENFIKDVNLDNKPAGSKASKIISQGLTGLAKAKAVGLNIRVILQQPCAITRAADVIEAKYLVSGWNKMLANPNKATKYAQDRSYLCYWKSKGFSDTRVSQSMKEIITGQETLRQDIVEKTGMLAGLADDVTWAAMYYASEEKVKATTDLIEGSEEFTKAVEEVFSDIVNHTQVIDSQLRKTGTMRSNDAIEKLANAFKKEPQKTYNMLHRAYWEKIQAQYSGGQNRIKKANDRWNKTLTVFAANAIVTAIAQSLVDAWRDDDDEAYLIKMLKKMFAYDSYASVTDFAKKLSSGEVKAKDVIGLLQGVYGGAGNILDNANILSSIPYVADIDSLFKGYSVTRLDSTAILTQIKNTVSTLGSTSATPYSIIYSLSQLVGYATGVGADNALKDLRGIYNQAIGNKTGYRIEKNSNAAKKNEKKKAEKSFHEAYESTDSATVKSAMQDIYNKAIDSGKDESDAWGAVREALKTEFQAQIDEHPEDKAAIINRFKMLLGNTKKADGKGGYRNLTDKEIQNTYINNWLGAAE